MLDGEAEDSNDLRGSEDGENNDLLDQEIYDASLIPGESFAPENYGEQCNGKQLLQATDDEAAGAERDICNGSTDMHLQILYF